MNDETIYFAAVISALAAKLNGSIVPQESGPDRMVLELSGERAGLRVVCRRGYGAESSRVRFSMSLQALMGAHDFRALPAVHELETAAAFSRGVEVIARQIESKIIAPAIPMRNAWIAKLAELATEAQQFAASIARYRAALPNARIEDSGNFHLSRPGGGYISGQINSSGGFYVQRMSSVPEAKALAVLALLMESDA